MRVNICGGGKVTVPEPELDQFHVHPLRYQQTGAGMAEVVEADVPKTVCVKQLGKLLRDIVQLNQITHLIDTDIAVVFPVVRPSAKPPVVLLFDFGRQQTFFHKRNKRQRTEAGFRLGRVGLDQFDFPVETDGRDCVSDGQGTIFKIDGIPFESQRFAAAQTIKRAKQNGALQIGSP